MKLVRRFLRHSFSHRAGLLKILDNLGWLVIEKLLRIVVALVVGIWIARYLGPEKYGLFSYVLAIVGIFSAIATLGLRDIAVRELVRTPDRAGETLGTVAVLQFFGGLFAYILAVACLYYLRPGEPEVQLLASIAGTILLWRVSDIALYWFESRTESKYAVWVQNLVLILFAAIKSVLVLVEAPLVAFAWAIAAEAAVLALVLVLVLRSRGPALSQLRARLALARTLLMQSYPLLFSGIAIMLYMRVDQVMLGQMVGDSAVGIYSVASNIGELWYFLPVTMIASVFPSMMVVRRRDKAAYTKAFQQVLDVMLWSAVILALPIALLGPWLITLLYGEPYAAAGPVLSIHIWALIFVALGLASEKWFLAENRQILSLQRSLLGVIVNVGLNALLIPRYGAIGAAWATVVSQAATTFAFDALQSETRPMFWMKLKALNPVGVVKRQGLVTT